MPQETGSILSRLTKTFEEKLNEIRNDRLKDKESKGIKDGLLPPNEVSNEQTIPIQNVVEETVGTVSKKPIDVPKLSSDEKDSKSDASGSPPKSKTSIVQDISDIGKTIRPKLSELRQRKSSRDCMSLASKSKESTVANKNKEGLKSRSFTLTSLLGRDEGLGEEQMLLECDVDHGVEAEEGACFSDDSLHDCFSETPDAKGVSQSDKRSCFDDRIAEKPNPKPSEIDNSTVTFWNQIIEKIVGSPLSLSTFVRWLSGIIFICFVFPLPRFLAGFLFGICVTGFICYRLYLLFSPQSEKYTKSETGPILIGGLPSYEDHQLHQGWMNELDGEYIPESYHVTLTHSVYLRLQGWQLKIDHPKRKVAKHARINEEFNSGGFIHHREYSLAGCQVLLLPKNLPRRWLWSRKYPICLRLRFSSPRSTTPVSINSTPATSLHSSPTHTRSHGKFKVSNIHLFFEIILKV